MKQNDSTKFLNRQYMLDDAFEIYYYKDFPDQGVAPHSHSFYEFYFFLEGKVSISIQERSYNVVPGDIIMIPPGTVHCPSLLDPLTPYRRFVLWIRKDYYQKRLSHTDVFRYLFDRCDKLSSPLLSMSQPRFNDLQAAIFSLIRETMTAALAKRRPAVCSLSSSFSGSAVLFTAGSCPLIQTPDHCAAASALTLTNTLARPSASNGFPRYFTVTNTIFPTSLRKRWESPSISIF